MAHMVRRPFARTATLVIIRMRARRMATGGQPTSQTASSLESAHGGDGDSVTDFAAAADSVADFMMAADLVTGSTTVAALVAAGSLAEEDSPTGAASPIVADSVVDLPAVEVAASQAVDFMAAVAASTEAVDFTVVAAVSMV